MLLLILFAGCLASCAAQSTTTTPPPPTTPTTTPPPPTTPTTTPPPPTTPTTTPPPPTTPPTTPPPTTTTIFPPSSLGTRSTTIQSTSVGSVSASGDDVVAILLASVQSDLELNETTIDLILQELHNLYPNLNFTLTVKNVTRV
ncbi:classical arabinogalactan protein 7-like [Sebastes umbrosus]|uniref:classical arabinogalactan protein 7-like n=1 Tax=Sebastes umbrosus TaxID=72105 RepID=UPI0018A01CF2|nr:classical arabinogalactan protein 7-like [Sebastes umbrosus]